MKLFEYNDIQKLRKLNNKKNEQRTERKMARYYAEMKKGSKKIYGECYTLSLLKQWIADNEKIGFKLVGEIERV